VAKRAAEYLAASGAAAISVTERGTIQAGGKITSFAARWWISERDAPRLATAARQLVGRARTYHRHGPPVGLINFTGATHEKAEPSLQR
jgi:hypothetical protein